MKFSKTWQGLNSSIQEKGLQGACASYKQWKKRAKLGRPDITQLENDLKQRERVFLSFVHKLYPDWVFFDKHIKKIRDMRLLKDMHTYILLHKQTFYKICKRLDKRCGTTSYMEWYGRKLRDHRCPLLSGFWAKRIEYELMGNKNMECPVCLEEGNESAILSCGHVLCLNCVAQMHGVMGKRGTFMNIIHHNQQTRACTIQCPMCRCDAPYHNFDAYHIIPESCADAFLSAIDH